MRLSDVIPEGKSAVAVMTGGRFLVFLATDRFKRELED